MPDTPPADPALAALEKRIDALRDEVTEKDAPDPGSATLGLGMRVGVEIAAGVIVGVVVGIMLDQWLGTKPWLLILSVCLGCAASFRTITRLAASDALEGRDL
jgi:ATP synthase protein I